MTPPTTSPSPLGPASPQRAAWRGSVLGRGLAAAQRLAVSDLFKVLFAVGVFVGAVWLLRRQLRTSSLTAIEAAFRSTPPWALAVAAAATLLSYLCLAASESWALDCVRRRLATWRILLVTFVSYTLSNGLGLSLATGGAARLRFYRAWGLGGSEIAAVTLLAGTAVTLSGAVTAGLALLTVRDLPAGFYALAALLMAPAWLWLGRLPRWGRLTPKVELTNPPLKRRLVALAGGVLDWGLSGLALFVLLPSATPDQFPGFLAVFILGSVVSAASGVPGGVGVFEAVVLTLSHRFATPHETVAALILYRLIYTIGPLSLTALGLAAHQGHQWTRTRGGDRLHSTVQALAPPVMAGLVFAVGAVLILAAANLPLHLLTAPRLLPEFPASGLFSSLLGAVLLIAAVALWRRLEGAYFLTLLLLVGGAGFEIWRGFGLFSAAPLLGLAAVLAPCRFAFHRRSAAFRDAASAPWLIACGLCGLSALVLALSVRYGDSSARASWWTLLKVSNAGPLGVAGGLSSLGLLFGLGRLLGPSRRPVALADAAQRARALAIIQSAKTVATDAYLALLGDKALVFTPSGQSFVMFGVVGAHWIAMSDPVGPEQDRAAAIDAFVDAAAEAQAQTAFYALSEDSLADMIDAGFLITKVGESAFVPLVDFDLVGKARQDLRYAVNHAEKAGLSFAVLPPDDPDTPWSALEAVSDAWLAIHAGGELSFSLGRFDRDYLRHFPIAVLRGEEGVMAFANLLLTPDRRCVAADLMRHRPDAPHGAMDALFVQIMIWGRDQGYGEFELGMAPLSGLEITSVAPLSRRLEAWVYGSAERLYGFKGLRAYKQKFAPTWRPVFLATSAGMGPVAGLADVGLLTRGGRRRA
ncbi:bifunctional lysylphosphatidylglycerol flippase/synthetase MprF [Caulobacter sp.]|uniref:bifunctional lysylphosphatidylglycerol flippase/synthetase MprF n=1 Tax=Caulobacter sp. TaxID=78 RepID=UPI003BA9AF70